MSESETHWDVKYLLHREAEAVDLVGIEHMSHCLAHSNWYISIG